ncbi:hypothetical protein HZH66_005317 [Vespula vulgaris]|uniref:Uncharacterized protein n=1 Tax=Vespula vulgaris TaxID=7454 RepID=A0A834NAQ5_VESVU|nr:hypothetical protein HZH66_005317 [Vespula vulgaris]
MKRCVVANVGDDDDGGGSDSDAGDIEGVGESRFETEAASSIVGNTDAVRHDDDDDDDKDDKDDYYDDDDYDDDYDDGQEDARRKANEDQSVSRFDDLQAFQRSTIIGDHTHSSFTAA